MSELSKDIENQCVLASIMTQLASNFDFKKPINGASVTYIQGNSDNFVSGMFGNNSKQIRPYLDITPAELSLLVPKVQFFKMIYSDSEPRKFIEQVPIIFRDHVGGDKLDAMFQSGRGRLGEVGLKGITLEQIGDHEDQKNFYKANVQIFADSIESFLNGHPQFSAPYHSLISFSGPEYLPEDEPVRKESSGQKESKNKIADPTYFEVKCVIGWAIPKDKQKVISKPVKKAIQNAEMVLTLNLVSHNLNFNPDGTMVIDIEYKTHIEMLLDSFRGDLFNVDTEKKRLEPGLGPVKGSKQNKGDSDPRRPGDTPVKSKPADESADQKEESREVKRSDILRLFQILEPELRFCPVADIEGWKLWREGDKSAKATAIESIRDGSQQGAIPIDKQSSRGGLSASDKNAIRDYISEVNKSSGKDSKSENKLKEDPNRQDVKEIPFLFLGHIIEAAVALLQEDAKARSDTHNYRVLCGPLTYMDRFTNQRVSINLGQIPVAISQFNRFLNELIVGSGRKRITLIEFLKELVSNLVDVALGGECSSPASNIMSNIVLMSQVDLSLITHNTKSGQDVFAEIASKDNVAHVKMMNSKFTERVRLKSRSAEKNEDKMFNYLILYASYMPVPYRDGDRAKDEKEGIFHYFLGRDRGIVLDMSFSKISQEGRRTEHMRSGGDIESFLIERYDLEMNLSGFPNIYAGQLIHINPAIASLGDSRSEKSFGSKLGLTGYYFIRSVRHKIDADNKFTTSVNAVNMGLFDGEDKPVTKLDPKSENTEKIDAGSRKAGDNPNEKGPGEGSPNESANAGRASDVASYSDGLSIANSILGSPGSNASIPLNTSDETYFGRSSPPQSFVDSLETASPPQPFPKRSTDSHIAATDFARTVLNYLNSDEIGGPVTILNLDQMIETYSLDEEVVPNFEFSYYSNGGIEMQSQVQVKVDFAYLIDTRDRTPDIAGVFGLSEDDARDRNSLRGVVSQDKVYVYECYKSPSKGWVIYKFFEA